MKSLVRKLMDKDLGLWITNIKGGIGALALLYLAYALLTGIIVLP